jgi:hypothetical protein
MSAFVLLGTLDLVKDLTEELGVLAQLVEDWVLMGQ